jgi:hypothetical protein
MCARDDLLTKVLVFLRKGNDISVELHCVTLSFLIWHCQ